MWEERLRRLFTGLSLPGWVLVGWHMIEHAHTAGYAGNWASKGMAYLSAHPTVCILIGFAWLGFVVAWPDLRKKIPQWVIPKTMRERIGTVENRLSDLAAGFDAIKSGMSLIQQDLAQLTATWAAERTRLETELAAEHAKNARPDVKVTLENATFLRSGLEETSYEGDRLVSRTQVVATVTVNFVNLSACKTTIDNCALRIKTPTRDLTSERFWPGQRLDPSVASQMVLDTPRGAIEMESNVPLDHGIGVRRFVCFKVDQWPCDELQKRTVLAFSVTDSFGTDWGAEKVFE